MTSVFTHKSCRFILAVLSICIAGFAQGQTITTFAGTGSPAFSGDGGPASAAQLNGPGAIIFDNSGNLYFSDVYNNKVRKITTAGIISTFAGSGSMSYGGDGGAATAASLGYPQGLAFDAAGNMYIADAVHNRIRMVNTSGIISTFAGNGASGFSGDGGQATAAKISTPCGIQVRTGGVIYFTDFGNNRVRKIDASGIITTVAGNGTVGYAGDGGPATAAKMYCPYGLVFDTAGNMFIAEQQNFVVRKITPAGIISTYAGTGISGYSGDGGPATAAQIAQASWMAIDDFGYIFLSDVGAQMIRVISPTGTISSYAGNGTSGFSGDGGPATAAMIYNPSGIAFDNANNTYFGDADNHRMRKITCGALPVAGPVSGIDSVCAGSTITLSDTTAGGTWVSSNISLATVSSTGVVTGIAAGTDTIMYIVFNRCGMDTAFFPVNVKSYASCHLGIPDAGRGKFNVVAYPNPGSGVFTLQVASANNESASVIVSNMLGERVVTFPVLTNKEVEVKLNVAAGIYFLSANTGTEQTALRIIVE